VAAAAVTFIHMAGGSQFQRANIICLNIHNRVSGNCIVLMNTDPAFKGKVPHSPLCNIKHSINQAAFAAGLFSPFCGWQ